MALKGVRVVEFAGLAPAPFCGMVLADFGATVIRIDRANVSTRDTLGNGKKSIAVDMKSSEGISIVRKLLKTCDVSLEPFRFGVMEKLGLGPDVVMKDNPKLIYARLTGYGQIGPFSHKAGHDINFLALSGLLSLFGRKNENPMFPSNLAADFGGGGLMCALGIVLALFEREKSGKGQIVEANMVHGVSYLGSFFYRNRNELFGARRGENLLDGGAPFYEVYKTKDDKYLAVGALEPQFYAEFLRGLELTEEEAPQYDFETNKEIFTKKFAEKTRDQWCDIFANLDACVTPVLEVDEAPNIPHNLLQKTFTINGNLYAPNPAPNLSRTPGRTCSNLAKPRIGQDTVEILKELGYSMDEVQKFCDKGVISYENKAKL